MHWLLQLALCYIYCSRENKMASRAIQAQIRQLEQALRLNPDLGPELQPILTDLRAELRAETKKSQNPVFF